MDMATQPITGLTYDDLASFPDDHLRRELIDGELIVTASPVPRHQRAVIAIAAALHEWCKRHGGEAFPAPLDVYFSDTTVLEPDVLFVSAARRKQVEEKFVRDAPDVVVEVSSPSTRRLELIRKREVYERFGVPEYWYVDLQSDRVEIHVLTDGRYDDPRMRYRGDLLTTPLAPGFEIAVDEVLGEPPTDD
jgi:Uma2 family endonuclease